MDSSDTVGMVHPFIMVIIFAINCWHETLSSIQAFVCLAEAMKRVTISYSCNAAVETVAPNDDLLQWSKENKKYCEE